MSEEHSSTTSSRTAGASAAPALGSTRPNPWRRRLFSAAVIIFAAVFVGVFSGRGEAERTEAMARFAGALFSAAERGDDAGRTAPLHQELLRPGLIAALAALGPELAGSTWTVDVADGPGPGVERSSATHHAVVRIDDVPRFGLRLGAEGDGRIVIAGYWTEMPAGEERAP